MYTRGTVAELAIDKPPPGAVLQPVAFLVATYPGRSEGSYWVTEDGHTYDEDDSRIKSVRVLDVTPPKPKPEFDLERMLVDLVTDFFLKKSTRRASSWESFVDEVWNSVSKPTIPDEPQSPGAMVREGDKHYMRILEGDWIDSTGKAQRWRDFATPRTVVL